MMWGRRYPVVHVPRPCTPDAEHTVTPMPSVRFQVVKRAEETDVLPDLDPAGLEIAPTHTQATLTHAWHHAAMSSNSEEPEGCTSYLCMRTGACLVPAASIHPQHGRSRLLQVAGKNERINPRTWQQWITAQQQSIDTIDAPDAERLMSLTHAYVQSENNTHHDTVVHNL